MCPSSTSSATTPPTTSSTTRNSSPTSRPWPATCPAGFGASERTDALGSDAAAAVAAAIGPPGQVATLILPADVSWGDGGAVGKPVEPAAATPVAADTVDRVAKVLRGGEPTALLLGGRALREPSLRAASRAAASCGAKLLG